MGLVSSLCDPPFEKSWLRPWTVKKSTNTLAMGNIDHFRFNLRIFCLFCHFCTKLGLKV